MLRVYAPAVLAISITLSPACFQCPQYLYGLSMSACRCLFIIRHFICYLHFRSCSFPISRRKAANSFTSLRLSAISYLHTLFTSVVFTSLLGLSGMLFGFFHSRTVRLTMVFFVATVYIYGSFSPYAGYAGRLRSSITSSSILHPNVCTPPPSRNFQYFCGVAGCPGNFLAKHPGSLERDFPDPPRLRRHSADRVPITLSPHFDVCGTALRCMYYFFYCKYPSLPEHLLKKSCLFSSVHISERHAYYFRSDWYTKTLRGPPDAARQAQASVFRSLFLSVRAFLFQS